VADETRTALNGGVADELGLAFFFFLAAVEPEPVDEPAGSGLDRVSGDVEAEVDVAVFGLEDGGRGGRPTVGNEGDDRFDPDGVGGLPDLREKEGSGRRPFSLSFSFSFAAAAAAALDDDGSASEASSRARLPFLPPPSFSDEPGCGPSAGPPAPATPSVWFDAFRLPFPTALAPLPALLVSSRSR
jgi:hypothetical protein